MKLLFGAVRLDFQTDSRPFSRQDSVSVTGWQETAITKTNGDRLELAGVARQAPNARTDVRFLHGKGGFSAIVTTDDLTYIALPGSRLALPDTVLELQGAPVEATNKPGLGNQHEAPVQTVTDQAMILGAGLATRFEPVSGDTTGLPKPGVPLVGEDSVIVALAKHLQKHGIRRIIVNTYYMPDRIKEQLRAVPGIDFVFIDEAAPSGTAGGLVKALQQGRVDRTKPILIMQGDAVTDADLSRLLETHRERNAKVTLGVQRVSDEDVSKVGIIRTDRSGNDGESGRVLSFMEKPSLQQAGDSRLGSIGFYVLSPEVYGTFERMGAKQFRQNRIFDYAMDFFPGLLRQTGRYKKRVGIWAQTVQGYWNDIGRPDQYVAVIKDVMAGKVRLTLPQNIGDYFANGVIFWPGTKKLADREARVLEGNIIVAKKPS